VLRDRHTDTDAGRVLSQNVENTDDITGRIRAASAAFGKLESRLWSKQYLVLFNQISPIATLAHIGLSI